MAIFAFPWSVLAQDFDGRVSEDGLTSPKVSAQAVPEIDRQIQLIEVEILLLKAELAWQNQEKAQLGAYLNELARLAGVQAFSPAFQSRYARLQRQYQTVASRDSTAHAPSNFQFNPSRMLALLPMSGPYAPAGEAVYQGLEDTFYAQSRPYDLQVLDTHIYDSMFEVWEWVRRYQPSFIFGPLQKHNVEQLQTLDLHTPILALNEMEKPDSRTAIRFMSPSAKRDAIAALVRYLERNHLTRIGVLVSGEPKSQDLLKRFQKALSTSTEHERQGEALPSGLPNTSSGETGLEEEQRFALDEPSQSLAIVKVVTVSRHVDESMEAVLQVRQSLARKNWLQQTTGQRLNFVERPRQDVDVLVSFLPYRQAMQVSPLLSYYHLNRLAHYWLPPTLPPVSQLLTSLPYWQATTAVLPVYYAQILQKKRRAQPHDSEIGTFYALGKAAAEAVLKLNGAGQQVLQTDALGTLTIDDDQGLHFYPELYWLDTDAFERLTP
ncbi:MAG: penicillin-binding protein activator [Hydrogenovibrio sp.]